jgi:hypothetical protein
MRKPDTRRMVQGDLFRPIPEQPNLPPEVRQKATRLLARLLREQQTLRHGDGRRKDVDDE